MKYLLFLNLLMIILSSIAYGQNLVPNHSFEEYEECPNSYSKWAGMFNKNVKSWYSPTQGTPDYFNTCNRGSVGVPENINGKMKPKSGNGYIGLGVASLARYYGIKSHVSREYITTKLNESLQKGREYCISFNISHADYSNKVIRQIGVFLSKRKVRKRFKKSELDKNPQVKYSGDFITNQKEWIQITGIYRAKGGEKYITIGNFQKDEDLKWAKVKVPAEKEPPFITGAYYYIDDVCLFPITDSLQCGWQQKQQEKSTERRERVFTDSLSLDSIQLNEPVVLNNIYFELDKAELLPASYNELNRLVGFLQKNLQMKIKIAGHTDSTGTAEYNRNLSRARAKAVVEYLKANGIDSTRLCYQGYGSTKPLDDNQTKKGRARNRRVEFIIKRK
jgi:outer membrane protein OmpA-like peptidoglycan-associated protein